MDEAGRGPLAGPVLAAALILREPPSGVAVDDSKRLTPLARQRAFLEIVQCGWIGIGVVWPEEIDRIGIHRATHRAMLHAIERLPVRPGSVWVDGRDTLPGCPVPVYPIVGGDRKSLLIACASIVAKVVRDRWMNWMDRIHPEYGLRRHKGYGTKEHLKRLRAFGPSWFHRYSFRPIREMVFG